MEGIVIPSIKPYKSRYEYNQANRLEKNNINFQYEQIVIPWKHPISCGVCNNCNSEDVCKNRTYTPDFWFPKSKLFVETKGRFTSTNRTDMSHITKQSEHEIRIVFMADNYCTKKKGMRYSRWCDLHGIKYAIGSIPLEWVEEDKC